MSVTDKLFALQDTEYRQFNAKLVPTKPIEKFIGVRIPALRKLAKELDGDTAREFMLSLGHEYHEENNLHSLLINRIGNFDACIAEIDRFLPFVDSWDTCDIMNPPVLKKHPEELLKHIDRWIASGECYTVRFGIGLLMGLYLDERFDAKQMDTVAAVRSGEYYVNMMVAWYFATALYKQYDAALPYILGERLDKWTHNKAIQKAIESRRISDERKAYLIQFRHKTR